MLQDLVQCLIAAELTLFSWRRRPSFVCFSVVAFVASSLHHRGVLIATLLLLLLHEAHRRYSRFLSIS